MPLFQCSKCGCVENTALCNYWTRNQFGRPKDAPALCSACDPEMGKWHGVFEQRSAVGLYRDGDGLLHYESELPEVKRRGIKVTKIELQAPGGPVRR